MSVNTGTNTNDSGNVDVDFISEDQARAIILSDPMKFLFPYIISLILDSIFLGVIWQQFSFWMNWSFKRDPLRIKIIVFLVTLLSTGFSAFLINYIVRLFVKGFGTNYSAFTSIRYVAFLPLWETSTVSIAQVFFAERAYKLNGRNKFILIILCPLILSELAIGAATTAKFYQVALIQRAKEARVQLFLLNASGVTTDLTLLSLITFGLWKSRTGWRDTDKLINRLITLAFETQLPGTIVVIMSIIQYCVESDSLYVIFFAVMLPKIYTMSFLAVLNARMSLSARYSTQFNEYHHELPTIRSSEQQATSNPGMSHDHSHSHSHSHRHSQAQSQRQRQSQSFNGHRQGGVMVSTETETWNDVERYSPKISINRRDLGTTHEILEVGVDVRAPNTDPDPDTKEAFVLGGEHEIPHLTRLPQSPGRNESVLGLSSSGIAAEEKI